MNTYLPAFNKALAHIQTPELRKICETIKEEYPSFFLCPASLSFHHAYESGLVQHTLEVVNYAIHMASRFPDCNRDILVTAALWHDVLKTREYVPVRPGFSRLESEIPAGDGKIWGKSDYAKTIGHICGGAIEFTEWATRCEVQSKDVDAVAHCILSHHGPVREWGFPVAPQSLEALLLHQADMLSANYGATK